MALSYEYSIGSVRAREVSLFSNADIERFLSCKSSDELKAALKEKNYGEGETVDEIIDDHSEKTWKYLRSVAPDPEIFTPFILPNDVHNLKVVLKGTLADRDYEQLLLSPVTIGVDRLREAVEQRRHDLLPEWLSAYSDEAYSILAHKGDARLSDAALDKALSKELLRLSEKSDAKFLHDYFLRFIYYNNLKVAIRGARAGAGREYLHKALVRIEGFDRRAVIDAAVKGLSPLLEYLSKRSEYDCNKAVESYKVSPAEFEKFTDNRLIACAVESCRRTCEGAAPLLGYYLGCEAEKKALHIIDGGLRTLTPVDVIRERMRELYG